VNPATQSTFAFGEFELDEGLAELRRKRAVVPIGPKPFALLLQLVRNRHRIVTKAELMREIWPDQRLVTDEAIRGTVRELRRALGDVHWIQNKPGHGYRFSGKVEESIRIGSGLAAPPAPPSTFVDREAEMARLRAALQAARDGVTRNLLLHGPPGIGKTRTALEIAAEARRAGFDVHFGRAHESAGAPSYWPWIEIFRSLGRARGDRELRAAAGAGAPHLVLLAPELGESLAPSSAPRSTDPDSERERFLLFDSVAAFLERLAHRQPLLLVLDDLHWADEASLALLGFIAQSRLRAPLMILGAHRDLSASFDAARARWLARARRDASAESIPLSGLTLESVARILEDVLGEPPSTALVGRVHAGTGGNPFFVSELARLLAVRGPAAYGDSDPLPVPDKLRDVVWIWISERSPECRALLQLASAIGPRFSLPLLQRSFRHGGEALLRGLGEAEHFNLLIQENGGQFRFAHGVIRETLYEELEEPLRIGLHRDIGEALEALHAPDLTSHLAELAHHFAESAAVSDSARAVHYAREAARRARSVFAHEEAAAHYRRALQALDFMHPPDAELRCSVLIELGRSLAASNAPVAAVEEALGKALDLARALTLAEHFARAATRMTAYVLDKDDQAQFDPLRTARVRAQLSPVLREALAGLPEHAVRLRGRALLLLARLVDGVAEPERAKELSGEARQLAESSGDPVLHVEVLSTLWTLLPTVDRAEERRALGDQMIALSRQAGRLDLERGAQAFRAFLALERGDMVERDAAREAMQRISEAFSPGAPPDPILRYQRAQMAGPLAEAERAVVDTFLRGRRLGFSRERNGATRSIQLWWLGLLQGDVRAILLQQQRYVELAPQVRDAHVLLGRLYAEVGALAEAQREVEQCDAIPLEALRRDDQWLFYLSTTAETSAMLGDVERTRRALKLLRPYRERIATLSWSVLCTGSVARTLGLLSAALGAWEESEQLFEQAIERNEAILAPVLVVWTHIDHARALSRHPEPAQRRRALQILDAVSARAREVGMEGAIEHARRTSGAARDPNGA
jgi:DNA-binding winged helix-turn-helix (wHTH) protein/tetratricopeptide (TPR) repeat protein